MQGNLYRNDASDAFSQKYEYSTSIPAFLTPSRLLEITVKQFKAYLGKCHEIVQEIPEYAYKLISRSPEFRNKIDDAIEFG